MIPVIAIFDVGKTNKKLLLFDEQYKVIFERSARFNEIKDEDGFPCENLVSLKQSVFESLDEIEKDGKYDIKAVNFSAYGASFVYLDENGIEIAPLYNYLKPYPEYLLDQFYERYGGMEEFSKCTASPVLGNLNSGMQLYRLKYEKPDLFNKIKYALHLPEYMSWLLSSKRYSDLTSIGCHTNLWNFEKNAYHDWVFIEGIAGKLAPLDIPGSAIKVDLKGSPCMIGTGLHDSSAALVPYLSCFTEPFILISTGTWCITLNPFNHSSLTLNELKLDCLVYLQTDGKPVKASRLFAGHDHDVQVNRIADHFNIENGFYRDISFDPDLIINLKKNDPINLPSIKICAFNHRDISNFVSAAEAYHQLIIDIVDQQKISTSLVIEGTLIKRIFVDGGFSKNEIYMNLLSSAFPGIEVYATSMAQASSLGAAIAIHKHWNNSKIPPDLIELKYYSAALSPLT